MQRGRSQKQTPSRPTRRTTKGKPDKSVEVRCGADLADTERINPKRKIEKKNQALSAPRPPSAPHRYNAFIWFACFCQSRGFVAQTVASVMNPRSSIESIEQIV